jgi:glyoxylase-like metal-dependent hydrolase (beta-lactamase superfamily II)
MQVIPGVHQITIRCVNIILIVEEKLTLVDTGFRGSPRKIIDYIRRLGRSIEEVSLIIITHNHLDHVGGLHELKNFTPARVAVHRADLSDNEGSLPYPKYLIKLMHLPPISMLRPLVYAKPGDVNIQLAGGEILPPLGGLEVIPTPGHTPGSISLFSAKKSLLIVGDAINNRHKDFRLPPKDVSNDLPQAIESIKWLAQLDFENLCCGHGKPIVGGASARLKDWLRRRGL